MTPLEFPVLVLSLQAVISCVCKYKNGGGCGRPSVCTRGRTTNVKFCMLLRQKAAVTHNTINLFLRFEETF